MILYFCPSAFILIFFYFFFLFFYDKSKLIYLPVVNVTVADFLFYCVCYIICLLIYKVYFLLSSLSVFFQLIITLYPRVPWPSNFGAGIKTKLKISAEK